MRIKEKASINAKALVTAVGIAVAGILQIPLTDSGAPSWVNIAVVLLTTLAGSLATWAKKNGAVTESAQQQTEQQVEQALNKRASAPPVDHDPPTTPIPVVTAVAYTFPRSS